MKGKITGFLQGFGTIAVTGLLGLVLGFAAILPAKASADVTCVVATQPGLTTTVVTGSRSCTIPSGVQITSATLDYELDDGGEITINGTQVFGVAPDQGTDSGSKNLSTSLFNAGSSFILRVTARNAMDSNGNTVGQVYGEATVRISTETQQQNPTVDISASPSTICSGSSSTLSWSSSNATTVSINQGIGTVSANTNGSRSVSPNQTTTYTITATNSSGNAQDSVTVNVNSGGSCDNDDGEAPDVTTKRATNIDEDSATLNGEVDGNGLDTDVWFQYGRDRNDVENNRPEHTTASEDTGSGTEDFSRRVTGLREDTTYYFRAVAQNSEGTDYGSVLSFRTEDDNNDDDNGDRPSVTIHANPSNVNSGSSSIITWSSSNADSCRASGGTNGWSGNRSRSGNFNTGALYNTTTFTIRCDNENGSDSDSATVTVNNVILNNNNRPTVVIYADQTSLAYNGATFVRWSTVGATSCDATGGSAGWAGPKSIGPGSFYTGSLTSTRTYTLTCYNSAGSDTDSVTISVRPPVTGGPTPRPSTGTSLVLVTSSIDRNQPILPSLDNTRPRPGDEITYTVTYQNIGTAAITNLVLRLDLPYEVNYLYSTPPNPTISGNTLIFNLGSLRANGSGTVTVRVRVREDAPPGALLNFPAVLSYIDPAGFPQTVTANVSAQVWTNPNPVQEVEQRVSLAANLFGTGAFLPSTLFGWLLLIILILLLIALVRYLLAGGTPQFARRTTTTTVEH